MEKEKVYDRPNEKEKCVPNRMATRKVKNKKALKTRKHKGGSFFNKTKELFNKTRIKLAVDALDKDTYDIIIAFKKGKFDPNKQENKDKINKMKQKINDLLYNQNTRSIISSDDKNTIKVVSEILDDIESISYYMNKKETIKENLKNPESTAFFSANALEEKINGLFRRNSKKDKNFKLLTNNHKGILENLKQAAEPAAKVRRAEIEEATAARAAAKEASRYYR